MGFPGAHPLLPVGPHRRPTSIPTQQNPAPGTETCLCAPWRDPSSWGKLDAFWRSEHLGQAWRRGRLGEGALAHPAGHFPASPQDYKEQRCWLTAGPGGEEACLGGPAGGSAMLRALCECKSFKEKFMKCLRDNNFENALCRNESKEYLECRMERSRLGLLHPGGVHLPELLRNPPEHPPGQQGEVGPPGRLGGSPSGVHGLPWERRRQSHVPVQSAPLLLPALGLRLPLTLATYPHRRGPWVSSL
nr:uncharacterized protein LOC102531233 isoform X3 [Vicugna pacos]